MNDIKHAIDALMVLKHEYCYMISINLTTYEFSDMIHSISTNDIREWVTCIMSHENEYDINSNDGITLDKVKKHFMKSNDKISFRVKKKTPNNNITWLSVSFYKSYDYSPQHEDVIMLVRNIDAEYKDIIYKQMELEELSYIDSLTSIGNRRALDKFMESNKNQIGVMYIDLNGLKETNDLLGHEFGDHLIQSCSNLLTRHFRKNECYRIGGDEFIVAIENIEKGLFLNKIDIFKKESESKNISLSIGAAWSHCNNMECLINKAEEEMRCEKGKFYESHKKYR